MAVTPLYNLPYYATGDPADFPTDSSSEMGAVEAAIKGAYVIKPGDQAQTVNITPINDTALVLGVVANATFEIDLDLIYGATATTGMIKIGWTAPAGATFSWVANGLASSVAATSGIMLQANQVLADQVTLGSGATNAVNVRANPRGLLVTAGTAGSLNFQWAQGLSLAATTIVRAGSKLKGKRIL